MNFTIRAATKVDCKDISRMIMELALFEKMTDQVKISSEELERDGFCPNPLFECLVAEVPKENKSKQGFTTVGYGLYFYTYSTWKGRSMHLEDLYVMPEFRGGQREALCSLAIKRFGLERPFTRLLRCSRSSGSHHQGRLALNTF
ncbi:thialysine N-epsilon-acetyltransferase-like isoform X2 [Hippocampus zosterae]|uniref:thialysine N-epsilon-acetyltransferase-like isoform X2 n=1 Tax=Hippocampus zosterae TaxID=109293 RepID=UPI00223DC2A1|nr:thialysine N-epsilon-acetyltransferase-like isoform X2 [Hippocampus zosterae]